MTMHGNFGDMDLNDFLPADDDDPPETIPTPGSAHLVVEDKCLALFTSAEWALVGTVGSNELGRTTNSNTAHSPAYLKRWTRQLIRKNRERLRRLGVDVPKTYLQYGGIVADLED
jgi:hypothetical protein